MIVKIKNKLFSYALKTNLILCMILLFCINVKASNEVSLLNSEGKSVAYIDVDDGMTIYLWKGKPVAYLDGENVYGFNGTHIGWLVDGAIFNHKGDALCVLKGRHPSPKYEEYKGYKEYKPYKSYKEYAPYKPNWSNSFSSTPCSLGLAMGSSD